jgi:trans-aconitate methyltransferase
VRVSNTADHWDTTYEDRGTNNVSWYEPTPRVSLELIASLGLQLDAPVIDIGGGASLLVGELVARGYTDVSLLDISDVALAQVREQLGTAVVRLHENILEWKPERRYELWHDRALLHFFTSSPDQRAYLQALEAGLDPGGFVVLGVFAPDGPDRCSGLAVERYDRDDLEALLGDAYVLRADRYEAHVTPQGGRQPFTWAVFQRHR